MIARQSKPYPAYKDSGVVWLEEIPKHWEVKRLKHFAPLQGGYAFKSEVFQVEGIPVVRMNNLRRGVLDLTDTAQVSPSDCVSTFALNVGDLLLGMSGSLGETGSLGNYAIVRSTDVPCQLNQRVGRFRLSNKLCRGFFLHFIASTPFTEPLIVDSTSTAQFNISPESVGEVDIGIPPIEEQVRIAAFLDRETTRIDALVAKKERLIELLQEKRTALITRAVTKGLDPTVPMKDSGVEWLGEIPAHWQVAPVYTRYEVALGKMLDSKRVTGEFPGRYLRNIDVQWDAVNVDGLPEMDFALWERDRYLLQVGDLLVCEGGEIGRTAIWEGQLKECFYQKAIHRLRPRSELDTPRLFYYLMYALAKLGVFTAGGNPNTIDHLTAVQLRHYRMPFPSRTEQHEIVTLLDREAARIDALVSKVLKALERLKEYRTALISAAVTGKIDVREEVP